MAEAHPPLHIAHCKKRYNTWCFELKERRKQLYKSKEVKRGGKKGKDIIKTHRGKR
jgi:hypothetical protein